jgi:hypothetical protein
MRVEMTNEPCDWFVGVKYKSHLDNFINERSIDFPLMYCEDDSQTILVDYIQCVDLKEIEKRDWWSSQRVESIKKWATPDKLRRLKYRREEDTGKRVIPVNAFHDMPMLSREYKLENKDQEKFKISDGIHRINRARELGMDCILSSVSEYVKVKKTDKDNIDVLNDF